MPHSVVTALRQASCYMSHPTPVFPHRECNVVVWTTESHCLCLRQFANMDIIVTWNYSNFHWPWL